MSPAAGFGLFAAIALACAVVLVGVVLHALPPDPCDSSQYGGSYAEVTGSYVGGVLVPASRVRDAAALPPRVAEVRTRYETCAGPRIETDYALQGISPRLATADLRAGDVVSVAPGSMTILDAHPLRAALWGDETTPRPFPARCLRGPLVRRRVVLYGPPGEGSLAVRSRRLQVDLQRSTVVTGRTFEGIPAGRRGDRVRVTGHDCRGRRHPRRVRMLATRVALPG